MKGGSLENDLRLQYLVVMVLGRRALDKISTVDALLDCVLDVFPMTFYSQLREHTTAKAGDVDGAGAEKFFEEGAEEGHCML